MQNVLSLRYFLSFAVSSEKIVEALGSFCTAYPRGEIDFLGISSGLSTSSSISNNSCFGNIIESENIVAKELIDWKAIKEKPYFFSNLNELLKNIQPDPQIINVINRFNLIKNVLVFMFFLGLVSGIVGIAITKTIGAYLLINITWMMCCISLYITAKLIIKEWKNELYVRKKEKR